MPAFVPDLFMAITRRIADGEYRVRAELPGVAAGRDLDVTVTDSMLTIHAERIAQPHAQQRTGFRYGTLRRALRLPAGAIREKITARLQDGVLTITVPAAKPTRPTVRATPVKS